jgi:putative ABC transport system ATP-binding protein
VTHENDIAAWARRVVRMRDGHIESDVRNEPVPEAPPAPGPDEALPEVVAADGIWSPESAPEGERS